MTERGSPSGMATTTMATPIERNRSNSCMLPPSNSSHPLIEYSMMNRMNSTVTIVIALYNPNLPMSFAMASSFYYKGVDSLSWALSSCRIFPSLEFSPTTTVTNLPSPCTIYVPARRTGVGTSCGLQLNSFPSLSI